MTAWTEAEAKGQLDHIIRVHAIHEGELAQPGFEWLHFCLLRATAGRILDLAAFVGTDEALRFTADASLRLAFLLTDDGGLDGNPPPV